MFASDFSIGSELRRLYKESDYFAKAQSLGYVVIKDVGSFVDIKNKCNYFKYIEIYRVLQNLKGNLPEYLFLQKDGEYCGKFTLKQFSASKQTKISLISVKKNKDGYYIEDAFDETPIIDKTKKEVKLFLDWAAKRRKDKTRVTH